VDGRYPDASLPRRLGKEPGSHRRAQSGRGRAGPPGRPWSAGCFGRELHPQYLLAFEQELARAANGDALIAAMNKRYPDAGLAAALQIGAKVAMGEMKWG
jgi:hypothetical protein